MKKGFTLIELLIVIALLGALAVGLLATVDPFEQLKKGRDTSIRNTAAEFYNSVIRYYAQRGAFPTSMQTTGNYSMSAAGMTVAIADMAAAGELKSDFVSLAGLTNLGKVWVDIPNTEKVVVCFNPESKAFRNDQNAKYDRTGGALATDVCPNPTSTACHVCFQ